MSSFIDKPPLTPEWAEREFVDGNERCWLHSGLLMRKRPYPETPYERQDRFWKSFKEQQ